jgi:hypothetical protein
VNTTVAPVTGKVKLDINDLDSSFFTLSIYPADEDWGHALSPEGTLPAGYVPDSTDQTLLTFNSSRILSTVDGKLVVIGDLEWTRVERTVTATPTEGHTGPEDGNLVIRNIVNEIKFLFPSASAEHLSEPLTPAMQQKRRVLEIVGSARIRREQLPELSSAMKETNWPGEDDADPQCSPARGCETMIVLDLTFLHPVPKPSAGMLSGNGEPRYL